MSEHSEQLMVKYKREYHGALLLLDLAPADPAAGAAALRALVAACREYMTDTEGEEGLRLGKVRNLERRVEAALEQLEAAHG